MEGFELRYRMIALVRQVLAAHPDGLRPKQVSSLTGLDFPLADHRGFVSYSALQYLQECGEVAAENHAYRLAQPSPDGWHLRPAAAVVALKAALDEATALPESDKGEHEPQGWSAFNGNLLGVLGLLPSLRMKPNLNWVAYVFREGGNGNGVVWTLPVNAAVPAPGDCPEVEDDDEDGFLSWPRPPLAIGPGEAAVEADGSPWSWLCLSMLSRALREFAACWHGTDWSDHELLGAAPEDGELTWSVPPPADFSPRVQLGHDGVRVRFWTFTEVGGERVVQHDDFYAAGTVVPVRSKTTVAKGLGGINA